MWALVAYGAIALILFIQWRRSGRRLGPFLGLGLVRLYARLWHGCQTRGRFNAPAQGPALLVSNHTCSADGTFLQVGSLRGLTFLFAREYEANLPLLSWVWSTTGCVPVNRNGRDVRAVRLALKRLREGRLVCVFPEGNLSGAGTGRLRSPKCGAAYLALKSRVPVFVAYISGGPQHSSQRVGWFVPPRRRVRVTFGPAVDLSAYYGKPITRPLLEEVTRLLMRQIAALAPRPRRRPS